MLDRSISHFGGVGFSIESVSLVLGQDQLPPAVHHRGRDQDYVSTQGQAPRLSRGRTGRLKEDQNLYCKLAKNERPRGSP